MRKTLAIFLLASLFAAPIAASASPTTPQTLAPTPQPTPAQTPAQTRGVSPVVDVIEIVGIIDIHVARYALERLSEAEREKDALVVFEVNSLGGVKISDDEVLPPLVRRIRDARVPVAVFIGPRGARAGSAAVFMAQAASIAAIGPSARIDGIFPIDFARPGALDDERYQLLALAGAQGRTLKLPSSPGQIRANEAVAAGFADLVTPSVAALLQSLDGKDVRTGSGPITLSLPSRDVTVRFFQPGPIRRLLHAFANPGLLYLSLLCGALLVIFELFVPGFGVAGVSGGLLLAGGIYGLTVAPASALAVAIAGVSLLLLTLDVARDELLVPTALGAGGLATGSWLLFRSQPAFRLSPWLIGFAVAGALIFFVPVMTLVRRQRKPVSTEEGSRLVGSPGDVRSMLNPEGFILVGGEIWRARSQDGVRMRVGETVEVTGVEGTLLIVRGRVPAEGNGAHS